MFIDAEINFDTDVIYRVPLLCSHGFENKPIGANRYNLSTQLAFFLNFFRDFACDSQILTSRPTMGVFGMGVGGIPTRATSMPFPPIRITAPGTTRDHRIHDRCPRPGRGARKTIAIDGAGDLRPLGDLEAAFFDVLAFLRGSPPLRWFAIGARNAADFTKSCVVHVICQMGLFAIS